jgi:hypothetical protein
MKQSFKIVRNAISPDTIDLLKNTLLLTKTVEYYQKNTPQDNLSAFGDEQSPVGFPFYGNIVCDALAVSLLPLMQEETGLTLYPTYTYGRIYWKGSTLAKHKDRPSCQYSATLCIDNDPEPWPIYMDGKKVSLQAGDMAIYKGCEVEHWRDPYEGNQQIQLFLHYVDANGIYKAFKFDKRIFLGIKI